MKYKELQNRVAIITGASRGIGEEIARQLADNGVHLTLAARSRVNLENLAEELHHRCDVNVTPQVIDVQDEGMVMNMMRDTFDAFGRIDILVNNAGCVEPLGILEMPLSKWQQTMNTNLTATFLCTREAARYMKLRGGKMVNVASTAGLGPRPGRSAYAAAKAAVINFSESMAAELKDYGIKVYCVAPGRTATALRRIIAPDEDPDVSLKPENVADTVIFLLSDHGDHLSQQPILIRK